MNLDEAIRSRYSVRQFLDKDVPDSLINDIFKLASLAPSAGNLQSYKAVVVRDKEKQKMIYSIEAPVFLVICALPEVSAVRYGDRGRNLYTIQDATLFGGYIQLMAVDLGLATVWIGAFREDKVSQILGLNKNIRPIAVIALGYPAVIKSSRNRRDVEEIVLK